MTALEALETVLQQHGPDLWALPPVELARRLTDLLLVQGFEIVPKTQHLAPPHMSSDDVHRG